MTPDDVLTFWLGEPSDDPLAKADRWWVKDAAFDETCRSRFAEVLDRAAGGALHGWQGSLRGRLGLVILLDQLSRNIHRGTPRAFAQDALAREVADLAFRHHDDESLSPVETTFLLMPFMHAEDVALQHRCVAGFEKLLARHPNGKIGDHLRNSLDYAKQHAVIVERFGRFPHRNAILGRPSTVEEKEFLTQPGSSF